MCDKDISAFLPALKFVLYWFVTNKIIQKLYNTLFENDNILFFDEDSGNVTFSSDEMGIFKVDLNNISCMKMILKLLFMSDFWLDIIAINNAKHLKK